MNASETLRSPDARNVPIVYGADWCDDTRRARRHFRRLSIAHDYRNIDEDVFALERACALNAGERRTPVIDLNGIVLVEPTNTDLTAALIRANWVTPDEARDRASVQNVGDAERAAWTAAGLAVIAAAQRCPRSIRWPLRAAGAALALTGISGWSPAYAVAGVSSLDGPGDRPAEASRTGWFADARRGTA
ncbi:MAG TPA: YgaP-like transmembrane domain [Vicinamibacterales bacterium]|nr:YgaP-like transmembrane domain [Vicinamibacterales bacterium]